MNLKVVRNKVNTLLDDLKFVSNQCNKEKSKLIEAEDRLTYIEQAQSIAQTVAEQIQQRAHNQIASVVTRCLQTVFYDDNYGFQIRFDKKRGKTDAVLILTKDDHEIENPLDYDSGAVCEMAGFALRLSCLMLAKPKLRRLLILDEPFKSISEEYWESTRLLIENLSSEFDIQIILVTHNSELQTGKIIKL